MGFEPQIGTLWVVVNERDELGSDLVPDYLTSVKDGAIDKAGALLVADDVGNVIWRITRVPRPRPPLWANN